MTIQIILLAMVAAFLGFRLYSVLGKRTGHEQEHNPHHIDDAKSGPVGSSSPIPDIIPASAKPESTVYELQAEGGVKAILSADRSFDVGRFMEGGQAAYTMILEAFWKGDREELASLCDEDVTASFVEAIDAREGRGEVLENRLVRIEKAMIVDAEYEKPMARITLRLDADITSVVRDKDGELIGGSLSDAIETHDVWTFARDLNNMDPNWKLVETDQV